MGSQSSLACCTQRTGRDDDPQALRVDLLQERRSINHQREIRHPATSSRKSVDESVDEEWRIVETSIEPVEFASLRSLATRVRDCGEHAACQQRPLHLQPQTLLRFLRGREGHIDLAEKMFRDSLDWRRDFGVDDKVAEWQKELETRRTRRARLVLAYSTDKEICPDRFGVPVWLMRMSVSDPAGMLREVGQEALLVNSLARMEAMHAHLRHSMFQTGRVVRGCVQVIDVGNYGEHGVPNWFKRMWDGFRVGKDAFKIFDLNYPETTRKIFIIRMARITTTIYKMCLPLVPPRTKEKMRIFDWRAAMWTEELSSEVEDAAQLPPFLTCDDTAAFAAAVPRGGLVPIGGDLPLLLQDEQACVLVAEKRPPALARSMPVIASPAVMAIMVLAAALTAVRAFSILGVSQVVEPLAAQ